MDNATCQADPKLERTVVDGMSFPLGVYPIEPIQPAPGYTLDFESADGDENDWEEWPDRYVFDVVVSCERLPTLVRSLLSIFPGRVFPILDVLGHDAYREIDPFISYDLVGIDRFMDTIRRYHAFYYEDGLCGFGAMCEAPFFYLFVDEHKIVTVRVEPTAKERVEKVLFAFDLEISEQPAGADAVAHEHRGVLLSPDDRPDLLTSDEIIERLRDDWRLVLNIDPEQNLDERGRPLGVTCWRCLVRVDAGIEVYRYAEVNLTADSLRQAETLAIDALRGELSPERVEPPLVISADRVEPNVFLEDLGIKPNATRRRELGRPRIWARRWLDRAGLDRGLDQGGIERGGPESGEG